MDTSRDTGTLSLSSTEGMGLKKTSFRLPEIECEGMKSLTEAIKAWTKDVDRKFQDHQVQVLKDIKTQNAVIEKLRALADRQEKKIADQAEAILYLEDELKYLKKRKNLSRDSDSDSGSSDDNIPEGLKKLQRARKFLNRVQFFASDYEDSEDEVKNQSVSRPSNGVAKSLRGISNGTHVRNTGAVRASNGAGSNKRVKRPVGKKTSDSETGFSDLNIDIDLSTDGQASLTNGQRSLNKKETEASSDNFKTPAPVSSLSTKRRIGKQQKMNTSSPGLSMTKKSVTFEGKIEYRCVVCKKQMLSKAELDQHLLWTMCG